MRKEDRHAKKACPRGEAAESLPLQGLMNELDGETGWDLRAPQQKDRLVERLLERKIVGRMGKLPFAQGDLLKAFVSRS